MSAKLSLSLLTAAATLVLLQSHTKSEFVGEILKGDATPSTNSASGGVLAAAAVAAEEAAAQSREDPPNSTAFGPADLYTVMHHRRTLGDNLTNPMKDGAALEDLSAHFFGSPQERGKLCLENVEQCMEEDVEYSLTSDKLSKIFFRQLPPFDLSNVPGISQKCKKHSALYIQNLEQFKLWALRMYDSSGKIPSGLLNGNINQLGDFDQCLSVNSRRYGITGQYCLAYIQVDIPQSSYMSALHRLVYSHYPITSTFDDPGHRVPRYSTVNWAMCVPHTCSPKDVELGLNQTLKNVFSETDIQYQIRVEPEMCQKLTEEAVPLSTMIVNAFFLGVFLLAILSTVYDSYSAIKHPLYTSFSLRRNFRKLVTYDRSQDDIKIIHGIRFLNAFMLVLAHKSMALFFTPYVNRTEMSEILGQPWTVLGRAASLYTDPFIMLSGTLTAYSLFGKLQRNEKLNILQEYGARLFRLVPTFGALILFATFVLPFLGSGPHWNLVVTHHANICKQYWWRNLLFIHNYFGFKDMCLTHTHHVGIDTQLFFISPLLILAIWKWKRKGMYGLLAVATVSTIMRYYITYSMNLSNYIHFGTSVKQLFETADYMYIIPFYRATVYIMGILLGYALRSVKNLQLKPIHLRLGNTICLLACSSAFFGPAFMGSIDYIYDATHAAWYAAFAPIAWCLSFAWIIFTTHLGYKGMLNNWFLDTLCKIYGWKGFLITTRLSYAIYLTQFPVFFYNVGTTRSTEHYGFFGMLFNFKEQLHIVFLSTVLTLLFDFPFQNIKNVVFKTHKRLTYDADHASKKNK